MIASSLINPMLPVLQPTDRLSTAIDWMEEFQIRHLAVTKENEYLGLVSEDHLLASPDDSQKIADHLLEFSDLYTLEDQHIFELIRLVNQHGISIVPVLHDNHTWAGSILVSELLLHFSELLGVQEKGAIIVLKIAQRDYSLTEISRLIESNGSKIISSYYASNTSSPLIAEESLLTLKLNRTDITPVIATLERFGYQIEEAHANDPIESVDQERLDMLLRYLAT